MDNVVMKYQPDFDIDWSDLPADMTEGFFKFHDDNPQVYTALVDMARLIKAKGHRGCGIARLFEALRYNYMINTDASEEPFKLNNNYRAYYSRLIMQREPDLEGFFTTRKSKADEDV